jgi:hypothetical protein
MDAYLLLWKTAEKSGWNAGFERMEGSLLGYEDWQNDAHMELIRRRKQQRCSEQGHRVLPDPDRDHLSCN